MPKWKTLKSVKDLEEGGQDYPVRKKAVAIHPKTVQSRILSVVGKSTCQGSRIRCHLHRKYLCLIAVDDDSACDTTLNPAALTQSISLVLVQ